MTNLRARFAHAGGAFVLAVLLAFAPAHAHHTPTHNYDLTEQEYRSLFTTRITEYQLGLLVGRLRRDYRRLITNFIEADFIQDMSIPFISCSPGGAAESSLAACLFSPHRVGVRGFINPFGGSFLSAFNRLQFIGNRAGGLLLSASLPGTDDEHPCETGFSIPGAQPAGTPPLDLVLPTNDMGLVGCQEELFRFNVGDPLPSDAEIVSSVLDTVAIYLKIALRGTKDEETLREALQACLESGDDLDFTIDCSVFSLPTPKINRPSRTEFATTAATTYVIAYLLSAYFARTEPTAGKLRTYALPVSKNTLEFGVQFQPTAQWAFGLKMLDRSFQALPQEPRYQLQVEYKF